MELFTTTITDKAKQLVNQVMDSGFLNQGKMVDAFEEALRTDFGLRNPVTVNSCTSSLHMALLLSGVGPGDEVILPAQTFISTGLSILMCGAKPVFADISQDGNISPIEIWKKITKKTKAVIAVHWGGYPANIWYLRDEVGDDIKIIEDAAHAFGANHSYGQPVGSCPHSDFCCFSLQSIKTLTTGDGGILCCKRKKDYEAAVKMRWFGMDKKNIKRNENGDREVDVSTLGFKYHMNDFQAALGLGNLEAISDIVRRRRAIAHKYCHGISWELVSHPYVATSQHSYWLYNILVKNRTDFIKAMKAANIPVSTVDTRIDKNTIFGGPFDLPGQALFDARQVSIPCTHTMTDEEVQYVIDTINKGW